MTEHVMIRDHRKVLGGHAEFVQGSQMFSTTVP